MRILDELVAGEEHVVRDVAFRRGVNIIWSSPRKAGDDNTLFRSGFAGHTAGKTTLCRLIRYVLGEPTFAPESSRRRIRQALPTGWVLGEVEVAQTRWAVARPLGIGPHPFCARDCDLDLLLGRVERLDLQHFLDAIDAAVTTPLPARDYPARDSAVGWDHVLPWLTRDQECRFADFLYWRQSSSESRSQVLTEDERQFVVRSVLGLIADAERQEQERNAHLVASKAAATARVPLVAHQADVDHDRVERILGIELASPPDALFGRRARQELEARQADLSRRRSALGPSDLRRGLREALEAAIAAETGARRDLEEVEERLAIERAALALDPGADVANQASLLAALPPSRGYCNVPIDLARDRGCPLATTQPHELDAQRHRRTAQQEAEDRRAVVASLLARAGACKRRVALAGITTSNARRAFLEATTAHEEQLAKLVVEQATLDQVGRLVAHAEHAWRESAALATQIAGLDREIKDSYGRQEVIRKQTSHALGRFSSRFDYVVRALVGDDVTAKVEASGRSIRLVVDEHGERDSAAFDTVKLLAFDLAAVTESVEGRGFHPRFLLHDGPREADMDPDIYERLFLYVRRLEECFKGEPSFQYIITTTTPPPANLRITPWLRLELHGAPATERLLGRDL
ncbi:DUF2326 domain-containing protein [Myxococcota bacterium]|nr:DUF2326 domain-containing protein [Myxococcota bacterium]